jgi:hypothetical protein
VLLAPAQSLLATNGQYPARYRTLVWRFLLRLPENATAYTNLVRMGVHHAYNDLQARYPMTDRRLQRRLKRCLSALAHWSPVFGELAFLPEFVFPFVKLFGSWLHTHCEPPCVWLPADDTCARVRVAGAEGDDLSAFECVMAVLLNWCATWAETFPYPPLAEMGRIDSLLRYHDPEVAEHLTVCGLGPEQYAWPIMRSAFSEVLTRDDVRAHALAL